MAAHHSARLEPRQHVCCVWMEKEEKHIHVISRPACWLRLCSNPTRSTSFLFPPRSPLSRHASERVPFGPPTILGALLTCTRPLRSASAIALRLPEPVGYVDVIRCQGCPLIERGRIEHVSFRSSSTELLPAMSATPILPGG